MVSNIGANLLFNHADPHRQISLYAVITLCFVNVYKCARFKLILLRIDASLVVCVCGVRFEFNVFLMMCIHG